MAGNTGNGRRLGVIKDRKQTYNPRTKQFVKMNTTTGKIIKCKSTPFKSVRKDANAKSATSKSKSSTSKLGKKK
jgi:hypothetical protein